ncbi:hypothetical protein JOH51_007035 [Rhizobium leguminosarum]|nr:hypothetical protein [Rhizobium leguminosarum]
MDVWIEFCFWSSVGCFGRYWRTLFSHAFTGEIDAIGIVNEAIQDGIGERWVCYYFPPAIQRHLTCNDRRATLVAVFDDLEEIAPLIIVELFRSPIIKDKQIGLGQGFEDAVRGTRKRTSHSPMPSAPFAALCGIRRFIDTTRQTPTFPKSKQNASSA